MDFDKLRGDGMEHSEKYLEIKSYYDNGLWNITQLKFAVFNGWITEEEFETITEEEYEAPTSSLPTLLPRVSVADNGKVARIVDGRWVAVIGKQSKTASGAVVKVSDAVADEMVSCIAYINPLQSGSGTPSPDNIRPISGFAGGNVYVMDDATNKTYFEGLVKGTYNVVDLGSLSWSKRTTTNDNWQFYATLSGVKRPSASSSRASVLCSGYSTISADSAYSGAKGIAVAYNADLLYVTDMTYSTASAFKTAMSGVYLIYQLATPITPTITPSSFHELLAEFGVNGNYYNVSWQSEAGTVYGGYVDLTTGVLTVTHIKATYDSFETFTVGTSGAGVKYCDCRFYTPNIAVRDSVAVCNKYNWISIATTGYDGAFRQYESVVTIYDNSFTNVATARTKLADIEVVFKLATPQTYQLTPQTVRTLAGSNTIWNDVNGDMEIEYYYQNN